MDDYLSAIRNITCDELVAALLIFLAAVCPGFLTIYYFHPELVKDLDIFKLILFSIALDLPVLFTILLGISFTSNRGKDTTPKLLAITSLYTAIIMHVALFMAYFLHSTFHSYLFFIATGIVIILGANKYVIKLSSDE